MAEVKYGILSKPPRAMGAELAGGDVADAAAPNAKGFGMPRLAEAGSALASAAFCSRSRFRMSETNAPAKTRGLVGGCEKCEKCEKVEKVREDVRRCVGVREVREVRDERAGDDDVAETQHGERIAFGASRCEEELGGSLAESGSGAREPRASESWHSEE